MAERWAVPAALDGERVDRVLALVTGLSRRDVNAVVDEGRVRVGGRAVTSRSRKVHTGERIEVAGDLAPEEAAAPAADAGVDVAVVYDDEAVLVVDKPAGLVVHPGSGNRSATLVHGLLARFPDLADLATGDATDRPGIVHRLDKGTSGLLMVARTESARRSLVDQLARHTVGRRYLALVRGLVEADGGLVDAPLGRSERDPTRFRVQTGGRSARTRYEVLERFDVPAPTTLVACRLETGRTHQIRVHLSSIGHPVVGDDRYGFRPVNSWRPLPPGRPFLHAAELAFDHPTSGERLVFTSELPEDLLSALERIRQAGMGEV